MTDKELADLVRLTGLVDRAEGDPAILLGAFLDLADIAHGDDGGDEMLRWRRRGQRAMDAGAVVAPQPQPTNVAAGRLTPAWGGAISGPVKVHVTRHPDADRYSGPVRVVVKPQEIEPAHVINVVVRSADERA